MQDSSGKNQPEISKEVVGSPVEITTIPAIAAVITKVIIVGRLNKPTPLPILTKA
jgi:hypothetical protein